METSVKNTATEMEIKKQKQFNCWMKNMFNHLSTKKVNVKLIDINPEKTKKDDITNYLENFIVQGTHKDRFENEFAFQIQIDKDRLKGDTAQNQVFIVFQHKINNCIKHDVDTNGQLYDMINQYIYTAKDEKLVLYKTNKELEKEKSTTPENAIIA